MIKKNKINLFFGIINILLSLNNTKLNISSAEGNVLYFSSCGKMGFKATKKSTPFAAKCAADDIVKKCLDFNIKEIAIKIKGFGYGRENSLKSFIESSLIINSIEDKTSIAYNGCRKRKKRKL